MEIAKVLMIDNSKMQLATNENDILTLKMHQIIQAKIEK